MHRHYSLQQRLFALTSALGIGVTLLLAAAFVAVRIHHIQQDLHQQVELAAKLLSVEIAGDPQAQSQHTLEVLGGYPYIDYACRYDVAGALVAASTPQALGQCPTNPQVANSQATLVVTQEVVTQELAPSGTLQVFANRSAAYAGLLDLALPLLLILCGAVTVVLLASRGVARTVAKPIARLTERAKNFDPEAPEQFVQRSGLTEVDALSEAFDRATQSLVQARERILGATHQQRAAQDAEREAREFLRQVVDLVPHLIFAIDRSGAILFANQAVAELYGCSVEDLIGNSEFAAQRPSDDLLFAKFRSDGQQEEVWHTDARTQKSRRFLVTRVPYTSDDVALVVGTDVTEEHRLQLQLQFSQRLEVIGTLAGGIAHDFNNLLTPILGYTSLLIEADLPADAHEKLRAVEDAAERARDVVQQILTFSRQQTAEPARELLAPEAVVMDAARLMRASVPPAIKITQSNELTGQIYGDPSQLHQVIVNLCTNATQAMEQGHGEVRLRVFEVSPDSSLLPNHLSRKSYACIEVADDGTGIQADVINHIFEPFFTTKEVGEGSGLGLSVVHGIVTGHGGDITVTSEVGVGTVFRVLLPLATQPMAELPGHEPDVAVLLVDDDESVLRVTTELLEHYGYRVTPVTDPRAALVAVQLEPTAFDVVITDHNMPELTGAELATSIRAVRPEIPILLITGFASVAARELEGIDHKLMKPVSGRELTMVIQSSLAARRSAA